MGNSFRPQPLPAIYPTNKTPFASDILEVGILVAFAMIGFSFLLIIPGIRGWEVRKIVLFFLVACMSHLVTAAFMGNYSSLRCVMGRLCVIGLQLRLRVVH